jgi:hypothetical protein
MFDREFRSEEEINKLYRDHIESLEMSGVDFDREGLEHGWGAALIKFSGHG